MARSCFLSYSNVNRTVADELDQALQQEGISVLRYFIEKPWDDPVERMARGITEEVGCLISLRLNKPLLRYSQLEVEWATRVDVPIVYVDDPAEISRAVAEVQAAGPSSIPYTNLHDRWVASREAFMESAYDLRPTDPDGPDNPEVISTIDEEGNWAAKNDPGSAFVAGALAYGIYALVAGVLGFVFLSIAVIFSWWVLIIAAPLLAGSAWLAHRAICCARLFSEYLAAIQRRAD